MRIPWILKLASIVIVHLLSGWLIYRALGAPWWLLVLASIAGHFTLDLITLVVHWLLDNYFSASTPVIGEVVFYFREHHIAPLAMFQRGYVDNNFENALIGLGFQLAVLPFHAGAFISMLVGVGAFGSAYITLIHKLTHLESTGPIARAMQRLRLIVSTDHHAVHHQLEGRNYGLCAGWVDGPVDALHLLEGLEWLIFWLFGVRPVHPRVVRAAEVAE